MSDTANANPQAAGGELQIPKHRLDEALEQVRRLREQSEIQQNLLNQVAQARQQVVQPEDRDPTSEELGIDPSILDAVTKIQNRREKKLVAQFGQHMAGVENKLDQANFLLNHGKDKASYLEKIQQYRLKHWNTTGTPMDMDTAYKLIRFDEIESGRGAPATKTTTQETPTQQTVSAPPAAATRVETPVANGGSTTGRESFEELEARLDQQVRSSGMTI